MTKVDTYHEFEKLFTDNGFEVPAWSGVGKGWYPLVGKLLADLKAIGGVHNILQTKEKFGFLRVYMSTLADITQEQDDALSAAIVQAETVSGTICELCGKSGKVRKHSWLITRCDECETEYLLTHGGCRYCEPTKEEGV